MTDCELFLTITVPPILTSFFTSYLSAHFLKKNDNDNKTENLNKERQNLAKALHTEIFILVKMYEEIRLPENPPKTGDEIKVAYISQNYISVYENNLNKIGILDKDDIPKIIEFYMCVKYLIDSLQLLSKRWEVFTQYQRKNQQLNEQQNQELNLKYVDVCKVYQAAREAEKRISNLFFDVLERLSKY